MTHGSYPSIIKTLPKVKINLYGVEAWLAQGDSFQIVFFEIQPGTTIPPHSHKGQFGIVLEGEMTLTIGDNKHHLKAGDSYHIPENVTHHATFQTFVRAIDFFDEPNRYQPLK
jgi:mannose-6-phosphate isomerase-like protein (cupin superfamily)